MIFIDSLFQLNWKLVRAFFWSSPQSFVNDVKSDVKSTGHPNDWAVQRSRHAKSARPSTSISTSYNEVHISNHIMNKRTLMSSERFDKIAI